MSTNLQICWFLLILFFHSFSFSQTVPVPPDEDASDSYQMYRGGNQHFGSQLMKGSMSVTPVLKWEVFYTNAPNSGAEGEPAIGDVNGDGQTDVIGCSQDGNAYAINGTTGAVVWTHNTGGSILASPAIGNIDGVGGMDVVVAFGNQLRCINGTTGAAIWTFIGSVNANDFWGGPCVADLDNDNSLEVVAMGGSEVYAINANGTQQWNYNIGVVSNWSGSPAVGDLNNDGIKDVVVIAAGSPFPPVSMSIVYAINGATGALIWQYTLAVNSFFSMHSPTIGDVNGDCQMDVIVPEQGGRLLCLRGNNAALQWQINGAGNSTPAVADIDFDCDMEIITAGPRAYNGTTGALIWQVAGSLNGWQGPSPRVADLVPGSPGLETVCGNAYNPGINTVRCYSNTGVLLWTYNKPNHTSEGMSVGDIDNDGCVEIVVNPDCCNGDFSIFAIDDVGGATACGVQSTPTNLVVTASNLTPCAGACINFTSGANCATGYSWTFPGGSPATSNQQNPTNICFNTPGTYVAQLIAQLGACGADTATITITVINCSNMTVAVTGASVCAGACTTLTATPTGGTAPYTYVWNPGNLTGQTINVCPTSTTTYTVVVTDAGATTASTTATVTVNPAPSITIAPSNPNCSSGQGSATATGTGNSPFTYLWSNSQTTQTATGLGAGTYTCILTDANGCTSTATVTITVPTALSATTSSNPTSCGNNTGDATANPSGGNGPYTYSWNPSAQTTQNATGLGAGTYTVTVTDANGCTTTATVSIGNSNGPTATATFTNLSCNGVCIGDASVSISGGTPPYTYLWTNSATTSSITGLCAGNYTVTVTDAGGCSLTQSFVITEPPALTLSVNATSPLCNTGTGSASATPGGGTAPYTYLWSNAQTGQNATGLTNGTYTVTITDANGCTATATAAITVPSGISQLTTATNALCNGGTGTATSVPSGGTPPYTYTWNNGQTTQTATGLPAGTYTVVITDANGCTSTDTITVTQPLAISISNASTPSACNGNTGTATATATNAVGVMTYVWSPGGQTTQTATGLGTGTYTVTVTDANGCTQTGTVTVNQAASTVNATVSNDTTIILGNSANLQAGGGVSYTWFPSTGLSCATCANPVATPATTTTYCVLVVDTAGCTDTACVTVTVDIQCGEIFVPNAFSPNNDGANDLHCVFGNCITEIYFAIFDRWGEKVFETTDPKICWDGYYKGKPMNTAVFAYVVNVVLITGDQIKLKGNISLIR